MGQTALVLNPGAFVHPMAFVDESVELGERTKVWQLASVTRGAVLGRDCSVSPGAMLDGSVYGDRVVISGGVRCGAGFLVGDDVFLGPNVVLCNDAWPRADKSGYDDDKLRQRSGFWAVIIGKGASIGANAVVLPGVRIGAGAFVAAGAVVSRNVPAAMLWTTAGDIVDLAGRDLVERRMRWAS